MGVRHFVLWPWEGGARLMGRSASDEAIEFVTGGGGDGGAVDLGGAGGWRGAGGDWDPGAWLQGG